MRKLILAFVVCWFGKGVAQKHPSEKAFVEISRQDARYLALSNGQTFIPVGPNICFPRGLTTETDVLAFYEKYFQKLAQNGGNFTRIWLSVPVFEIEHQAAGKYDLAMAKRIDKVLALAKKHQIRVKFCLEHFRKITNSPAPFPTSVPFDRPVYESTIATIDEFFLTDKGKKLYLNRIDFLAKRYGNNPSIFGWELWNEVNAVGVKDKNQLLKWTQEMLPEVKKRFPRQLVMQSLGSFDTESATEMYRVYSQLPTNQLAQVHRYLDLGASLEVCKGPMEMLASNAVLTLRAFCPDKPVLLSEVGAVEPRHAGPSKLYEKDTLGILLHDLLFAPFFAGAAAPGQSWHWDYYIDKHNLWWHFARFSEAIKGFDPVIQKAQAFTENLPQGLHLYGLEGENMSLLWIRDPSNDWKTELVEGKAVEAVAPQSLTIHQKGIRKVSFYDVWTNEWSSGTLSAEGRVVLPSFSRSIVVKLEK